jgi:propionyl-CoA carboxylase alpha chain
MGRQAVALARAVHYQSAGTVEFVVGKDRGFYFLEMNTRLQVEHPVTEMITGLDLVELMIRVAAGEKLPVRQQDLHINGWAIECRINAEDPLHEFLPSVGRFVRYQEPETVAGRVRVDTGAYEGGEIPLEYDSLVAKLVCHGATRDEALARTRDALNAFVIRGVSSNIAFQAALTRHPRFVAGRLSTAFIAEEFPEGFHGPELPPEEHDLLVMVAAAVHRIYLERASRIEGQMPGHELRIGENFVVIGRDTEREVGIRRLADGCDVRLDGVTREIRSAWRFGDILMRGTCDGVAFCMQVERPGLRYRLSYMGVLSEFSVLPRRAAQLLRMMPRKLPPDMSQFLLSPMPGLLAEVLVQAGQPVKAGERLVVIEAMKMRNTLHAERKGTVAELLASQGDVLAVGQPVLRFGG